MFHAGQQIGGYVLIERLGKGGFGDVWLAEKRSGVLNKKVAIKLPHEETVNLEAIRQEAELWEQVSKHENVLTIFDADIFDGQVAIISEYAEGGSLDDKLKRDGKFPVEEAIEMTIGILKGLEHLHLKNIVHRDIKPQNILLQGSTPRLADFGISRAMNTANISSVIIGTDSYMAPEALDGVRNVQTDIWSVGVVLYLLLKGSLPFPQEHYSERMFAIVTKDFAPLPDEIPENLKAVVRKALAKNPAERFRRAEEMREALNRILTYLRNPTFAPTEAFSLSGKPVADTRAVEDNASVVTAASSLAPPPTQASPPVNIQSAAPNRGIRQGEIELREESAGNRQPVRSNKIWLISIPAILGVILLGILGLIISNRQTTNGPVRIGDYSPTRSPTPDSAMKFYEMASDCEKKEDYDCAIKYYTKASELNPQSHWYYYYRGEVYKKKKNYDLAIKDFNKALELKSDSFESFSARCLSYYHKKLYDQAIRDCTSAINLDNSSPPPYVNRGMAYDSLKLYDSAIADYNKAIELSPNLASAYNNRGVAYENKNNYDLAIEDYRKAIALDSENTKAKDNLDSLLNKQKNANNDY